MDSAPRTHALGIATLAAETVNWDIFLRAHLDIPRQLPAQFRWQLRLGRAPDLHPRGRGSAGHQRARPHAGYHALCVELKQGPLLRVRQQDRSRPQRSTGARGRGRTRADHDRRSGSDPYNRAVLYYLFSAATGTWRISSCASGTRKASTSHRRASRRVAADRRMTTPSSRERVHARVSAPLYLFNSSHHPIACLKAVRFTLLCMPRTVQSSSGIQSMARCHRMPGCVRAADVREAVRAPGTLCSRPHE